MRGFRYLEGVSTLALDAAKCTGCGRCVDVCPHAVFMVEGGKAKLLDRDACIECGACARNCPAAAVTVQADVGCATGIMNRWLREKGFSPSGGGECCS